MPHPLPSGGGPGISHESSFCPRNLNDSFPLVPVLIAHSLPVSRPKRIPDGRLATSLFCDLRSFARDEPAGTACLLLNLRRGTRTLRSTH